MDGDTIVYIHHPMSAPSPSEQPRMVRGRELPELARARAACVHARHAVQRIHDVVNKHRTVLRRHGAEFLGEVTEVLEEYQRKSSPVDDHMRLGDVRAQEMIASLRRRFPQLSHVQCEVAWAIMMYPHMLDRMFALNRSRETIRWHAARIRKRLATELREHRRTHPRARRPPVRLREFLWGVVGSVSPTS